MLGNHCLMKRAHLHLFAILLGLDCCSAFAQDAMLECFNRDLDNASKISACGQAISQGGLPDETRALAMVSRGEVHAQVGNTAAALSDYDAALELAPGDFTAHLDRAQLLETLGRTVDAETDYSAVVDGAPRTQGQLLGDAYARRGALRIKTGDIASGITDLGEVRRFDPRNPAPFKTRGAYFLNTGKIEQAAVELEQAVDLNAGDSEAQIMLGSAQLKLGQPSAAVKAFSSALIVEPGSAEALRGRATAYGQQQNYAAAVTDYTAALNVSGEDAAALEGRGVALLRVGAFAGAVENFDRLLVLRPNDNSATFFRAHARFQNGDADGAVTDFNNILSRRPGDGDALVGRGIARQFSGDYDGAEADFTTALESVPHTAQPLANRGFVRVMKGAFTAAVEDLTTAMSLPNAPPHLALWRFVAEARAGKPNTDPLALAMRGLDSGQWPAPIVRYFLGEASGDEIITAAIKDPAGAAGRLCEAYFFLGQAALILDDTAEAERLFNAALVTAAVRYTEYAGAKAELKRLGKTAD
jgi:lipoprotein NlpI